MAESVQIATLEGGELKIPSSGSKLREVVLALPLNRLLVKMIRVPADQAEDPVAYATPFVKALSPYPDDPLRVSCETLREAEDGRVVLAAAMPESSAEDVAMALDASGINVTRVDALELGLLPALLPQVVQGVREVRRLLLIGSSDGLSAIVLDGDLPCALRALSPGGDLVRELMLLLIEAESFAGPSPLAEIVTVGEVSVESLETLAPVRALSGTFSPMEGLVARAIDPAALDVLPESWHDVLLETRFKRKMKLWFSVAGVLWAAALLVLLGVPQYDKHRIGKLEKRQEEYAPRYNDVKAKTAQIEVIKSVSNHDFGCLETLRVVTAAFPEDEELVLDKWEFSRGKSLKFGGKVESKNEHASGVLLENLRKLTLKDVTGEEDDAETPFFAKAGFSGAQKNGSFSIECFYEGGLEEER